MKRNITRKDLFMAQTQETTHGTGSTLGSGAFGAGGFEAILPLAKEAWGVQLKTAQVLFDTTTKLSQSIADYYQSQAAEGLKLTQTCFATLKKRLAKTPKPGSVP
jgi:hypothetical protein